jgi:HAD superfamily hydrolase (TIGR01509 family)
MKWAVIFDMDGVIIDSEPFHWEVNKRIFNELGVTVSEAEYQQYIGTSNTDMWTSIKHRHCLAQTVTQLVAMQVDGNIQHMKTEPLPEIQGVVELIRMLHSNGVPLALASSSPHRIIEMVLSAFDIRGYFDAVVSGEDFKQGKPAPDIFLKASELLGVSPQSCVVIEDSTNGVLASEKAGMHSVGFINKNSGMQNLDKADFTINCFSGLSIQKLHELVN